MNVLFAKIVIIKGLFMILQMLKGNSSDACEIRDPCQHGGICISTDSGPICECRNPDYEGEYCEKGEFIIIITQTI